MIQHGRAKHLLYLATALGLVACAADPQVAVNNSAATNLAEAQYTAGLVNFDYSDFFTQTSPNALGCAGDVKNLYDPITGRSLASSGSALGGTLLPAFIKNVSVDISDANSVSTTNKAFGCSYGSGAGQVGANSCATFDYASDGGVHSNYGGSMLLIGGIQGSNYAGIVAGTSPGGLAVNCGEDGSNNTCATSVYALGVDSLPANAATDPVNDLVPGLTPELNPSSNPISSFLSLSSGATYSGPQDFVGAAGAYDAGDGLFALFGGSAVIGALGSSGSPASTSEATWIFNLTTQTWTQLTVNDLVNAALIETYEQDGIGSRNLTNTVVGRAVFGYTAVQGLAVNAMSNTSAMNTMTLSGSTYQNGNMIDSTDRIAIVGGEIASGGIATDAYKFNPTYGPEWVDTLGRYIDGINGSLPAGAIAPAASEAVQYLQNYHTEPLFNTTPTGATGPLSIFEMFSPSASPQTVVPVLNFGLTALRDNTNVTGSGYLLYMGGFDMTQTTTLNNPQPDGCPGAGGDCSMMIYRHAGRALGAAGPAGDAYPSSYAAVGNLPTATISMTSGPTGSGEDSVAYTTTQLSPMYWQPYTGTGAASPYTVPYAGGSTLLPGFNLEKNDVVFFGGTSCSNYLLSTATCTTWGNTGKYFRMTADPMNSGTAAAVPSVLGTSTFSMVGVGAPQQAGMAAARGADANGNPMIVAWGGMSAAGSAGSSNIFYLYNAGTMNVPIPTWVSTAATGVAPTVVTNGALVFSHVTKKFYLFGGYNSGAGTESSSTWELSVGGAANCGTAGGCTFTWRQLDGTSGLIACSPNCPAGRRSHRMVEVNYANANPGGTVGGVTSGESTCSTTQPCSYGIFMEDGTADGVTPISDRWMFDPTANDGNGLWQQMHEMPARTLSAMASVDYALAASTSTVHRAVMFGGETGFSDPNWAHSVNASQTFVAPTLGDTWMYDYDAQTWNRVQLLGTGYYGALADSGNEFQFRQAYDATNPANTDTRSAVAELSPPPTSGQVMVTRTLDGPAGSALAIPEIYMIGGRLKDGSYQTFDHVYKFCAGSTGESYSNNNAVGGAAPWLPSTLDIGCDAYNATTNASSTSPQSGYVGRWLRKTPAAVAATSSQLSSFMGAAAYDSTDDVIAVFGGLQFNGVSAPTVVGDSSSFYVTDSTSRSVASTNAGAVTAPVYEYTPPSVATPQGSWAVLGACGGVGPPNRYGHSMVYDTLHKQLVVVGGYDVNGNALTQNNVPNIGGDLTVPDMWKGVRTGGTCYTWTQITSLGNTSSTVPSSAGLSHMIAAYIPAIGYGTGLYSTFDSACVGNGPSGTKYEAGGVYFDIDRTQLGSNENLLLNLTFIPLGPGNDDVNSQAITADEQAVFEVHLIKTGQSASQLQSVLQPRYFTYADDQKDYPYTMQNLAVIAPPTGQPRTEQVLIPLNANPGTDRIRIDRTSGSSILISASLFRMGQK